LLLAECPTRWFKNSSGFRLQASGFRLQASGFRLQARSARILTLFTFSFLISSITGCDGMDSRSLTASQSTTATNSLNLLRYDGGFIFADREHVVGVDVATWGLASLSQIQRIHTSCECVRATLGELDQGRNRFILVVHVAADSKLSRSASLAVKIEAVLADESKRILSFEFTHVAIPAMNGRD
jgi:hypothetical protein